MYYVIMFTTTSRHSLERFDDTPAPFILVIQRPIEGVSLGNYSIFMAIADAVGWDSRERPTGQYDLVAILPRWRSFFNETIAQTMPLVPQRSVQITFWGICISMSLSKAGEAIQ